MLKTTWCRADLVFWQSFLMRSEHTIRTETSTYHETYILCLLRLFSYVWICSAVGCWRPHRAEQICFRNLCWYVHKRSKQKAFYITKHMFILHAFVSVTQMQSVSPAAESRHPLCFNMFIFFGSVQSFLCFPLAVKLFVFLPLLFAVSD